MKATVQILAGESVFVEQTDNAHRRLVELANRGELPGVPVRIEQQWPGCQARNRHAQELKRLFRLN